MGVFSAVGLGSCSSVVEHSLGKGEVDGSIPSTSSKRTASKAPGVGLRSGSDALTWTRAERAERTRSWLRLFLSVRSRM